MLLRKVLPVALFHDDELDSASCTLFEVLSANTAARRTFWREFVCSPRHTPAICIYTISKDMMLEAPIS